MHHTYELVSDERHRHAVGNSNDQREALFLRYQRVSLSSEPSLAHPSNPIPRNLTHPSRSASVHRTTDTGQVFGNSVRLIADLDGDIQGAERRFGDAALAGEEPHLRLLGLRFRRYVHYASSRVLGPSIALAPLALYPVVHAIFSPSSTGRIRLYAYEAKRF
jgi:hypothetical protein